MNIITRLNKKKIVSAACLRKVKEALGGVGVTLKPLDAEGRDFELCVATRPPLRRNAEVKSGVVTRAQAFHSIIQMGKNKAGMAKTIVFSDWVPDHVAAEYRKAGVSYVDSQGNLFLWKPPHMVIDIRGHRPEKSVAPAPGRLIEPGGLKVIHHLLSQPKAMGETLREIATGSHVALGTAQAVVRELAQGQWILPSVQGGRRFRERRELIDLFVKGYALKLRPALFVGRYRHSKKKCSEILNDLGHALSDQNHHWALTGAMAARTLTPYLEPDVVTLFVDMEAQHLLEREHLLRDDSNGNIILLKLLASENIGDKLGPWPVADPVLVYAELLYDGRPREVETASMIYEQRIASGDHGAL